MKAMKPRRLTQFVAVLASVALVAGFGSAASGSEVRLAGGMELSDDNASQLAAFFDRYGVPMATQEYLLDKLERGVPWDSLSEGVEPVSTDSRTVGGMDEMIHTYGDGSIGVTSVEAPGETPEQGTITPMAGISGCTATSSGVTRYRKNCTVKHAAGLITMSFTADYQWSYYDDYYSMWVKSAKIDSVDKLKITVIGGTFSDKKLSIIRRTAGAQPALARASMDLSGLQGWIAGTVYLELFVPRGDSTLAYVRFQK